MDGVQGRAGQRTARGEAPEGGGNAPRGNQPNQPIPLGPPSSANTPTEIQREPAAPTSKGASQPTQRSTVLGPPSSEKLPFSPKLETGAYKGVADEMPKGSLSQQQSGQAAGARALPTHLAWEIRGLQQDVERLQKEAGPNKPAQQVNAVCRVLNNCNKHDKVLQPLFGGLVGDSETRNELRDGIRLALALAHQHLQSGTPQVLKEWPICQLFNGIRGMLSCTPFRNTDEQEAIRANLTALAESLLAAIRDPSILALSSDPVGKGGWTLLPYSTILLGLLRIHEERLVDLSSHQKVLQQLLDAVVASHDEEGWDIRGIANASLALGGLLHGVAPPLTAANAKAAAQVLAELIDESIHDPYEQRHWNSIDCSQAWRGLRRMLDAGVCTTPEDFDVFSRTLGGLKKLQSGQSIPPAAALEKPESAVQASDFPALPEKTAQSRAQAHPPMREQAVPASEPTTDKPTAQRAKTTQQPKPGQQESGAPQRLAAKRSPRAVVREIIRLKSSVLGAATASDLCQWITLVSTISRRSAGSDQSVRMLAAAVQQRAQGTPAPKAGELCSLLLAMGHALEKFPACTHALKAVMQTLCKQLTAGSAAGMRLEHVCSAVQGSASLIADGDETARQALRYVTKALTGGSGSLQSQNFDLSRVGEMLGALAPALGDPEVLAVLKQLTARFSEDQSWLNLPKVARATALAEIVANAPKGTQATGALVELMNALARGLAKPPLKVTPENIDTTRGRHDIVCSLLLPHWTIQDKGLMRIEPPSNAGSAVLVPFFAGVISLSHREKFRLGLEPSEHLSLPAALGHLELARDRMQDTSGAPEKIALALEAAISMIEFGASWMSYTGGNWQATVAETTLYVADTLIRLGDDAVKKILAQLSPDVVRAFRGHLEAAEFCFVKEFFEASDRHTAQRGKATALRALMDSAADLPTWTDKAADNDTLIEFLKRFPEYQGFEIAGLCLYGPPMPYKYLGMPMGLQTYSVIPPLEMKRCLDKPGTKPVTLEVFCAPWIPPGRPYHEAQQLSFCGPHALNNLNMRLRGDPSLLVTKPILDAYLGSDHALYSADQLSEFNNANESLGFPRLVHVDAQLTDTGAVTLLSDAPGSDWEAFGILLDAHHTFPDNGIGKHIAMIERSVDGNYAIRDSRPMGQSVEPQQLGSSDATKAVDEAVALAGVPSWLRVVASELAVASATGDLSRILLDAHGAAHASQASEFLAEATEREQLVQWIVSNRQEHGAIGLADRIYAKLFEALPSGARGVSLLCPEPGEVPPAQQDATRSGPDIQPAQSASVEIPKDIGDALAHLERLTASKDFAALQQLAALIPKMGLGKFDFNKLSGLLPQFPVMLGQQAGRAAVRALAERLGELASGPNAPLEGSQAMRLVANIACNAVSRTDKEANAVVFLLMDVVARKCSKKPVTWKDAWWTSQRLDTYRGRGVFVFSILKSAWKGGRGYVPPADASMWLARVFATGKESLEPAAELEPQSAEHFEGTILGIYDLICEQHGQCKAPDDYKKLMASAINLVLGCVNLTSAMNIPVEQDVLLEAYKAFLDAILAWNDPASLIKSLPPASQTWLGNAVSHTVNAINTPSSGILGIIQPAHVQALEALRKYLQPQPAGNRATRRKK